MDLGALVAEIRDQLAGMAAGRKIEWRIGSLPTVSGDPAMLRLVFTNLLSNAVKYTGGRSDTVIEIDPSAVDEAATKLESVPLRTYMTFGADLPRVWLGVPFANATLVGIASATASTTMSFFIQSLPCSRVGQRT